MKNKISIAPMVDRTDRNFRKFVRMINKDVLLYTEMITAQAILNGDLDYIHLEKTELKQLENFYLKQ